jgi:hypothetical protein
MKMSISRWKTRTKPNSIHNVAVAIEFIPKKDEARVGDDQGGSHNMGLRLDTIQRPLRPKTGNVAPCRGRTG